MSTSTNPSSQLHLGTWLSIGSPVIAELASECGFDWLLIDLEHGCATDASLLPQLQASRGTRIVRVGAPHPDLVSRALDWGAEGIMFPHVSTVESAKQCVDTAHYPPRGHRGFSRTVRAYGYGLRPPADGTVPPAPKILAQIETVEGVANAADIAAVEGVDVLFVGPADLKFDLQARGSARSYEDCLKVVTKAAAQAGKQSGILARRIEDLASLKELGFTWIAVDSDLAILREQYVRLISKAKS